MIIITTSINKILITSKSHKQVAIATRAKRICTSKLMGNIQSISDVAINFGLACRYEYIAPTDMSEYDALLSKMTYDTKDIIDILKTSRTVIKKKELYVWSSADNDMQNTFRDYLSKRYWEKRNIFEQHKDQRLKNNVMPTLLVEGYSTKNPDCNKSINLMRMTKNNRTEHLRYCKPCRISYEKYIKRIVDKYPGFIEKYNEDLARYENDGPIILKEIEQGKKELDTEYKLNNDIVDQIKKIYLSKFKLYAEVPEALASMVLQLESDKTKSISIHEIIDTITNKI